MSSAIGIFKPVALNVTTAPLHSIYSFSGSNRWLNCPAAVQLSKGEPNPTNPAAELGTAAHELGEFCIKYGVDTHSCIGMTFNKHVVDVDMAEAVNIYVGHINQLTIKTGVKPLVEQRVVMTSLGRNDVYGTSDIVLVYTIGRKVYIVDYKNGRGVVNVVNNSQLICYAIATLDMFTLWSQVDEVITTIVQPNVIHNDGVIRSHSYTITELSTWQQRIKEAITNSENPNAKPIAGEWCQWGLASYKCRARMQLTLETAFTDCPIDEVSDSELLAFFSNIKGVERHLKSIEQFALRKAQKGSLIKGHKLVKTRPWAVVEDEPGLIAAAGDNADKLYDKKLVGITKAKKVLPEDVIAKFYIRPEGHDILVPITDSRPAVNVGSAQGVFTSVIKE